MGSVVRLLMTVIDDVSFWAVLTLSNKVDLPSSDDEQLSLEVGESRIPLCISDTNFTAGGAEGS